MFIVVLSLRLSLRSYDLDIFSGPAQELSLSSEFYPPLSNNVRIFDSVFLGMYQRALSIYSDQENNLMIERTTFYNVSTPEPNYGAIYFYTRGNSSLRFVCANRCYTRVTSGSYQFAYISTGTNGYNCMYYCTLANLDNEGVSRYYPISLINGYQWIQGLNSSRNTGYYQYSGPNLYPTQILHMNFSNICHNVAQTHYTFYVTSYYLRQNDFFECNFINNSNQHPSYYVLFFSGTAIQVMERCIFARNKGLLFYGPTNTEGNLIILSCSVAHEYTTNSFTQGRIQIQAFVITAGTITQSHALQHLSTEMCIAEIAAPISESGISAECFAYTPPQTFYLPTDCNSGTNNNAEIFNIISVLQILSVQLIQ